MGNVSHGTIDISERDLRPVVPTAHRGPTTASQVRNDLLPLAVLLGAVYGWVVAALAVIVAAIAVLVN
jgi:hypothetical protein